MVRKMYLHQNADSIRETIQKTTSTMTLLVSAIAVISLVVGGIGVMNIMLVWSQNAHKKFGYAWRWVHVKVIF